MRPSTPYRPFLEIAPIDISTYCKGGENVDFVHVFESGKPGPCVMVNALTHGNEMCGAYAIDFLFRNQIKPKQGRLILSFANVKAYHSYNPTEPFASRFVDEDFNRLWADDVIETKRPSAEWKRARELLQYVRQADFLLDIHSMHQPSPPLMMCGMQERAIQLAMKIGFPTFMIRDRGHANGKRMRDYQEFDDPKGKKTALLIECGSHFSASSVDVAIQTTLRFLLATGAVEEGWAKPFLSVSPLFAPQLVAVEGPVTIQTEKFRFAHTVSGMEVFFHKDEVLGWDGDKTIHIPWDNAVMVMPTLKPTKGLSAVRIGKFVPLPSML